MNPLYVGIDVSSRSNVVYLMKSDTFSTTALAVYEEFESAEALANMDLHQLTEFIIGKGKNRFPAPESVAKAIQKAARSSYRLPKTVNDSINQVLSISISSMRAMETQIKAYDKAIAEQMALIPNTLTSIKGIGPVYSAGTIAEKDNCPYRVPESK